MSNYPLKIRLLKDKYPAVKGNVYTLKYKRMIKATDAPVDWCCSLYDTPVQKPADYNPGASKLIPVYILDPENYFKLPDLRDEIPADHYTKKDWFEPVPEQPTSIEEEISAKLTPLMESALKVLEQGVDQLQGLKAKGWDAFKQKMKKIIEEDDKKS